MQFFSLSRCFLASNLNCLRKFSLLQQNTVSIKECRYSWLRKNGNCQNKIDTFLSFFHRVRLELRSTFNGIFRNYLIGRVDKWTKPNLQ
jgi:hypothetical protein